MSSEYGSPKPRHTSEACNDCGCPGTSPGSVRYFDGETRITDQDLFSPIAGFGVNRLFSNQRNPDYDGPVGYNWFISEQPYMAELEANDGVVLMGYEAIYFDESSGNYTARYGLDDTYELSHDSGNNLFTLTIRGGTGVTTYEFNDFAGTNPLGSLKKMIDPYGIETTVISYDTDYIEEMQRSVTVDSMTTIYSILYEFYNTGDNAGHVEYATLRKKVGAGSWTDIRRTKFTYYSDSNPGNEDYGSLNDLKLVTVQIPDGSGGWDDAAKSYYRYYKSGDSNGFKHGLKYHVGPEAYSRMEQDSITPATATNAQIATYAEFYYEYEDNTSDAMYRSVTKEVSQNCASCGGGGSGTTGDGFVRTENSNYPSNPSDPPNTWKWKIVTSLPDGNTNTVYTNDLGQVMLEVLEEVASNTTRQWFTYYKYDSDRRVIEQADSSAVASFSESSDGLVTLETSSGLIHVTDYYSSTTATDTTAGGVDGYVQYRKIKNGSSGSEIKVSETKYFKFTNGGDTIYPVAEQISYPDAVTQTTTFKTTFSYTFYTSSLSLKEQTTTLPAIPVSQNGDGTSATTKVYFDDLGNLTWQMDERGIITKLEYDEPAGLLTKRTDDVGTVPNPPGWTPTGGSHLDIVTEYTYDDLGRQTEELGPEHEVDISGTATDVHRCTWTVYKEGVTGDETWTGIGYRTGTSPSFTYTLVNPVQISKTDKNGRVVDAIASKRTTGSGKLDPDDTFSQGDWSRWTHNYYNCAPLEILIQVL